MLENAVVLPGREDVEVEIPVKGTEPQIICLAKKTTPGYVGKLVEMIPEERALKAGVMRAYTSSTLKYTGNPGEKQLAKGTICAVCSPGTVLPAGTLFTHEGFSYAADTECRAAVSADIPVRSEHPAAKGRRSRRPGRSGIWTIRRKAYFLSQTESRSAEKNRQRKSQKNCSGISCM